MFEQDASGDWSQIQRLSPSSLTENSFCRRLVISGDYLAIAAYMKLNSGVRTGSVYMYKNEGGKLV